MFGKWTSDMKEWKLGNINIGLRAMLKSLKRKSEMLF